MVNVIPDEFLNGSKELNEDKELLAVGLLRLASVLGKNTQQSKIFRKTLGLKIGFFRKPTGSDENRISFELLIFYLFWITRWMGLNYVDDPKSVLDRLCFHAAQAFGDSNADFIDIVNGRFHIYYDAMSNEKGAGPIWWMGKQATLFILDKKDIEDKGSFLSAIMLFSHYMKMATDSTEDFVVQKKYLRS